MGDTLQFSYLDAEKLFKERGYKEWNMRSKGELHVLKCEDFETWLKQNTNALYDYATQGTRGMDKGAIDKHLASQEL